MAELNTDPSTVELGQIPPMAAMQPGNTLREFLLAGLMEMFGGRTGVSPGVSGTIDMNGHVFGYELTITRIYTPSDVSPELKH